MAKGADSKVKIYAKLQEVFPDSFFCNNGKEFRISMSENGEPVEIKVALTCAKVNVGTGGAPTQKEESTAAKEEDLSQPSEEELERVQKLMKSLDF